MDKFISYCQIAFKSRQVEFGDALIPCIQRQNAYCVVMDTLTGNNRKKKLRNKCSFYQIPLYELESQRFEQITNKAINSFAITSKEIAEEMRKLEG